MAQENDIPALLSLIKIAEADKNKIVILPRPFRQGSLLNAIRQNRLFIAEKDGHIIGYKKLFTVTDAQEKKEILSEELRTEKEPSSSYYIDKSGIFSHTVPIMLPAIYDLCIYNGADFTDPEYRGQRINSELTASAFKEIKPDIESYIKKYNPRFISMIYGITCDNAGKAPGQSGDRTVGIVQLFREFAESLPHTKPGESIFHMRFPASKPSFHLEATELRPLPDDQAVPGFGCVLAYPLGN